MTAASWLWRAGGIALLVATVFGAHAWSVGQAASAADAAGYARADEKWLRREEGIRAAAGEETRRARAETAALQTRFDQLGDVQHNERINHEITKSIAVAAALAGTERLSVAVNGAAAGAVSAGRASEGPALGAGLAAAARADLMPGTAAVVFRLAGEHGQLVRDYNAVVERYEIARATCNAE